MYVVDTDGLIVAAFRGDGEVYVEALGERDTDTEPLLEGVAPTLPLALVKGVNEAVKIEL